MNWEINSTPNWGDWAFSPENGYNLKPEDGPITINVEVIVPNRLISEEVQYRAKRTSMQIVGTVPWHPKISSLNVKYGRFLSDIDMRYKKGVCVIDEKIVKELFVFDYPIGQDIKLAGNYYRVVGVVNEQENSTASDMGASSQSGANIGSVYIPLSTVQDRFGDTNLQMSSGSTRPTPRLSIASYAMSITDVSTRSCTLLVGMRAAR